NLLARAIAAGQPPAGKRAPRDHAHPVALAGRKHVILDLPDQDRVGRLLTDEPLPPPALGDPLSLDDLAGGKCGGPDVANLSGVDQVTERRQRLVDVGIRLRAVDLVQVDPVGAEPPQAVLDLPDDPPPRVSELVWI